MISVQQNIGQINHPRHLSLTRLHDGCCIAVYLLYGSLDKPPFASITNSVQFRPRIFSHSNEDIPPLHRQERDPKRIFSNRRVLLQPESIAIVDPFYLDLSHPNIMTVGTTVAQSVHTSKVTQSAIGYLHLRNMTVVLTLRHHPTAFASRTRQPISISIWVMSPQLPWR